MTGTAHVLHRSRRRKTAGSAALATALLAGLLAGCSSDQPGPTAPAQAYFDAYRAALATGITNAAQFYAPEVRADWRSLWHSGVGRGPMAQFLRDTAQDIPVLMGGRDIADTYLMEPFEPVYVSLDGALDPVSHPYFQGEWHGANIHSLSEEGIAEETYLGSSHSGEGVDIPRDSSEPLALMYLAVWTSESATAVSTLYSNEAVLRDSLRGLALEGGAQIGDAAPRGLELGGLPGASLRTVALPAPTSTSGPPSPDRPSSVPAVFISAPSQATDVVDRIVLLLDVGSDGDCREHIGVALWLDEQRLITREERFHRLDSLDRCWEQIPSGAWWESVPVPDSDRFTMTSTTDVTDLPVALWNGTPTREGLLVWALEQFPSAGLPLPDLTSSTFAPPHPDPWTTYGFVKGAPDVVLPSTWAGCPDEGCEVWPADARATALAELTRSWLAGIDRQAVMASYAEDRGLVWTARRASESRPALDRAAATLVWGLMDDDFPPSGPIADVACEELEADFADLTAAMPMRSCPTTK